MCINSFVGSADSSSSSSSSSSYVVAQNRFMKKGDIEFYVKFDDSCRFEIDDIEIIWDKSVPGFALPQMSSLSPRNADAPQEGDDGEDGGDVESGQIFFDAQSFNKLLKTNKNDVRALEGHNMLSNFTNILTRNLAMSKYQIGVKFPCEVKSFEITDSRKYPVSIVSSGLRHVISKMASAEVNRGKRKILYRPTLLDFKIEFAAGDGCKFDPSSIEVILDPADSWMNTTLPDLAEEGGSNSTTEKEPTRVTCVECTAASSAEECRQNGRLRECDHGEVCLSERKQISKTRISVTSMCHKPWACPSGETPECLANSPPGGGGDVGGKCTCCCSDESCSGRPLHCIV